MSRNFLATAFAVAALGVAQSALAVDYVDGDYEYSPSVTTADVGGVESCQMPVTKAYKIKPNFCPQALVYMIPGAVGPGCCGCGGCGPYGIPPIYAAGQNVMVRQTPAMQERVKEFLTELGALVPRKTPTYN